MSFSDLNKLEDEEERKEIEEEYLNEKLNNVRFEEFLSIAFENEKIDKEDYLEEVVRIISEEICGLVIVTRFRLI